MMTNIIQFNISTRRILKYIVHKIFGVGCQENPNPSKKMANNNIMIVQQSTRKFYNIAILEAG